MSAAECASEVSTADQANEWAVQANEQTEERMGWYSMRRFRSHSNHCALQVVHFLQFRSMVQCVLLTQDSQMDQTQEEHLWIYLSIPLLYKFNVAHLFVIQFPFVLASLCCHNKVIGFSAIYVTRFGVSYIFPICYWVYKLSFPSRNLGSFLYPHHSLSLSLSLNFSQLVHICLNIFSVAMTFSRSSFLPPSIHYLRWYPQASCCSRRMTRYLLYTRP